MSAATKAVNTRSTSPVYLGLAEGADFYGISQRSLRRMIAEGQLRAVRVGKRQIRIRRDDLESLARPIPTAAANR